MWTWSEAAHPHVAVVFAGTNSGLDWCDRLDGAATGVISKVLCVCAATAVAREVLAREPVVPAAARDALNLVEAWIDEPTAERFERICETIFPPESVPPLDPHGVVWCALRTATSTAEGYGEAGWALRSTCSAAFRAGLSADQLREIAARAVATRAVA